MCKPAWRRSSCARRLLISPCLLLTPKPACLLPPPQGIPVMPVYSGLDVADQEGYGSELPGVFPYTR